MRTPELIRTGVFWDGDNKLGGTPSAHLSYEELAAALREIAKGLGEVTSSAMLLKLAADEVDRFRATVGWVGE